MDDYDKYVVPALSPIDFVVWGEQAMGELGVNLVICNWYMIIPAESDLDAAAAKLLDAGFTPAPWSLGTSDPAIAESSEMLREIHKNQAIEWESFDRNSIPFLLPNPGSTLRVVLLRSSFVGLAPPKDPVSAARFQTIKNQHLPDKELLLWSFIRTLVRHTTYGSGPYMTLQTWAIAYLYGQLMIADEVLDATDEEDVKNWFNEAIRRGKGGLDRTTVTKRVGRVNPSS